MKFKELFYISDIQTDINLPKYGHYCEDVFNYELDFVCRLCDCNYLLHLRHNIYSTCLSVCLFLRVEFKDPVNNNSVKLKNWIDKKKVLTLNLLQMSQEPSCQ